MVRRGNFRLSTIRQGAGFSFWFGLLMQASSWPVVVRLGVLQYVLRRRNAWYSEVMHGAGYFAFRRPVARR